ncbi:hypothetical protein GCM10010191_60780 [Actinomadura vinacea]|uniref:Transmembrane protein n=1 Tax=Actinomadura vinacea TaxID=115336 RepID=A0ABN3JTU5_9ACTN
MRSDTGLARVDRLRRRCGFDRNELRRDVDRRQRSFTIALVALYLGAAPIASVQLSGAVYEHGLRAEKQEAATRYQVVATIIDTGHQSASGWSTPRAAWAGRDGRHHTGTIDTWRGEADSGERQRIWVDVSGRPAIRPRAHSQTLGDGWSTALGTSLAIAAVLWGMQRIFRHHCDRRRYREWDSEWSRFDNRSAG